MTDGQLPGMPDLPPPVEPLSADQRRTHAARAAIAWGYHPFGPRLALNGRTCGECDSAVQVAHNSRRYWKCLATRGTTRSAASDLRISWPACERFIPATDPVAILRAERSRDD